MIYISIWYSFSWSHFQEWTDIFSHANSSFPCPYLILSRIYKVSEYHENRYSRLLANECALSSTDFDDETRDESYLRLFLRDDLRVLRVHGAE